MLASQSTIVTTAIGHTRPLFILGCCVQEERAAAREESLSAALREREEEAESARQELLSLRVEAASLQAVEAALKESVGREGALQSELAQARTAQVAAATAAAEKQRVAEGLRAAERLESQKMVAAQMSLESAAAESDAALAKLRGEFESYMTAKYLVTLRRMSGEPPRYRCHLGCILLKMAAISCCWQAASRRRRSPAGGRRRSARRGRAARRRVRCAGCSSAVSAGASAAGRS